MKVPFLYIWHVFSNPENPKRKNNPHKMKKAIYLLGLAFFFSVAVNAQANNAILFAENGEKFQVILNGILQNATPETNVKMTQLVADHYKARIVFADAKLGFVDFNMFFNEMGSEVTWNIKQNNKGQYVTRYVSAVPIAQAPQTPSSQTVVVYTTTAPVSEPVGSTTTTTTHSQTTTSNGGSDNISINMGVSGTDMDGTGGGSISINASGFGMEDGATTSSSTTTTTTTHSSTTTTTGSTPVYTNTPPPTQVVYVQGYNGKIGCPMPMNPADFGDMKETIRSKDFESTKLTIAKQVLQNNCLTSQQVKEVLTLFDFETTKVDYAKYAYDHTYDLGNYYKINDAFEFESSVTDLNNYISAKR